MVQRLTISVDDDLYGRLKRVKNNLHVSRVCQVAIRSEVEMLEIITKGEKMVIEKLKKQKHETVKKYEEEGRRDGVVDAQGLDYNDFLELSNAQTAYANSNLSEFDPDIVWNSSFYRDTVNGERLKDVIKEKEREESAFDVDFYISGWLQGVLEFWDSVKDKI